MTSTSAASPTYLEKILADNQGRLGEVGLVLLGEHVVIEGTFADALGVDSHGAPVLIARLPTHDADRGRALFSALAACRYLDAHADLFATFLRRSKRKAPAVTRPPARLLLLTESIPKTLVAALSGLSTGVKLARMRVVANLDHPIQLDLVFDSSLPEPLLVFEEPAFLPHHETEEVLISPLVAALKSKVEAFGDDVTVSMKATHVGFYRSFNFAVAHDHGDGLEVGFYYPSEGKKLPDRLHDAGDWGWASVNVYARVRSPEAIDADLLGWIRDAYARA